jgi:hypothetical protein
MKMLTPSTIAKTLALISFSALSALAIAPAQAVILNFESLAHDSSSPDTVTSPYQEQGFQITGTSSGLRAWSNNFFGYAGSTALIGDTGVTISRIDGGAFTLSSIDLASFFNDALAVSINVFGTSADGVSTFTQTLITSGNSGFETRNFNNDFSNIVAFGIGNYSGLPAQIDNINVTPTGATVPEPFTILGTIFGAGYSVALKRKLAKTQSDKQDIS